MCKQEAEAELALIDRQAAAIAAAEGLEIHRSAAATTGYLGVYRKRKGGRFEGRLAADGRDHYLGSFRTPLQV